MGGVLRLFIVQIAVLGGGPVLKAKNFFLGVFVFGGLLIAINQYTALIPELMFARAALIIEDEGKCLRIKSVPQGSAQIYSPFRGRSRYLAYKIDTPTGSFSASLHSLSSSTIASFKVRAKNIHRARQNCPNIRTKIELLKMRHIPRVIENDPYPECKYFYRPHTSSDLYINEVKQHADIRMRCGTRTHTVNCNIHAWHSGWTMAFSIPKNRIQYWREVTEGGRALFDEILQPLPACPIQISIPIPII